MMHKRDGVIPYHVYGFGGFGAFFASLVSGQFLARPRRRLTSTLQGRALVLEPEGPLVSWAAAAVFPALLAFGFSSVTLHRMSNHRLLTISRPDLDAPLATE